MRSLDASVSAKNACHFILAPPKCCPRVAAFGRSTLRLCRSSDRASPTQWLAGRKTIYPVMSFLNRDYRKMDSLISINHTGSAIGWWEFRWTFCDPFHVEVCRENSSWPRPHWPWQSDNERSFAANIACFHLKQALFRSRLITSLRKNMKEQRN